MKFNVTFRCTLSVDLEKHPPGEELGEYLAARFRDHGLSIQLEDNYEDFAWLLGFPGQRSTPWILVGYLGGGDFEWLVGTVLRKC